MRASLSHEGKSQVTKSKPITVADDEQSPVNPFSST